LDLRVVAPVFRQGGRKVNSLKPLLIVAVLAGIGYGVYVRINSSNDAPPPGVPGGWNKTPELQLGESGSPGEPSAWQAPAAAAPGGAPPPFVGAPAASAPSAPPGGEAPAYNPMPAPDASAPPFADPGAPPAAAASNPSPSGLPQPNANGYLPPQDPAAQAAPPAAAASAEPQPAVTVDRYGVPQPGAPSAPDAAVAPQAPGADRYATPEANTPGTVTPAADAAGTAPARPGEVCPAAEAGGATPAQPQAEGAFADALAAARRDLEAGQLAVALKQLSRWYDDPRLTPEESQQLVQLLDQVAGTVVYSTQHLLEAPYEVQPGERLEDIGQKYSVPWQLLAKINGIQDPNNLRPGERLKVVRGPFGAIVNLQKRELTLFLADGSYAGRFPIGVGQEHPPREGTFAVSDKVDNPVYRGKDKTAGPGDPANPLGQHWIGLGSDLGIHGTDKPENVGRTDLPGSISLTPRDIKDVYDILATGSRVTIRR
jgi:hypothetical protein